MTARPAAANGHGEATPLLTTTHTSPSNYISAFTAEFKHALNATIRLGSSNILLVCVPLGLMGSSWGWSPAAIFALNFLAMLPLASILTFATEQLAAVVGSVAGGLINATFGNAVEMIVSYFSFCSIALC